MNKVAEWFTSERRQAIQAFLGSLAPLAVLFGVGDNGTWEQVLVISGAVMIFAASLLSLVNVRINDWATQGWAIVRGAIYALAMVVSPALVTLGVYNDDINTTITTAVSLSLSALSSLVAILANGRQQNIEAHAAGVAMGKVFGSD